ncbi:MAG: hypothetical protein NDI77_07335 [Geobacteraceae bacterium]|nr:hypothetical protein [Geobacteraceae bacterium]
MATTSNQLDLSILPPASRKEIRDFFQFLLERRGPAKKRLPSKAGRRSFTDLCGKLTWKGDAVAAQRSIRDEW